MQHYSPGRFQILPSVVKNLLIINGIFFLATLVFDRSLGIDLINRLGLHYFSASDFRPYQFLSYMFMHGGFAHIFFNMFALWMFGSAIENYWGPKRFLIYYLFTGFGAAIIHYISIYIEIRPVIQSINTYLDTPGHEALHQFLTSSSFYEFPAIKEVFFKFRHEYNALIASDPGAALQLSIIFIQQYKEVFLNQPVVVGASGAVFGLLLAFGWMFPNSRIYIYLAIPVKAKYFVILYGALEFIYGISGSGGNIAHFAHLGGMFFGLILLKLWNIRRLN
jgi:membrane associated rhomboid family serine protease